MVRSRPYRIAIVTDALTVYGGAERVLERMLEMFPQADLFSLVDFSERTQCPTIVDRGAKTTFIQVMPLARRHFRKYLQLWPIAVEQFDLADYDVVISSHYAVANGAITGPNQIHLSYTHSPMRYVWDLQHQYLKESNIGFGPMGLYVRAVLHQLRKWDVSAAQRVDYFATNSQFVARRVAKFYNRFSEVIHPPVDVSSFAFRREKEDFFVTVSRLVPYKRVELIVKAFNAMPDKRLLVIGEGPELENLKRLAGKNVEMLGHVPGHTVADLLGRARAFIFAAVEDFGIAPVEAQACGTPVIGLGRGGLLETVLDLDSERPTGVLFEDQSAEALIDAVRQFDLCEGDISAADCRARALEFDTSVFQAKFSSFVARGASKLHASSRTDLMSHFEASPKPVRAAMSAAL